jgi:hypothetical protein
MIEVSLYAIEPEDHYAKTGRCVARNRFDKEAMGTSVEEFVRGFLKDNFERFSSDGREINTILEENKFLSRMDLTCINHLLENIGYTFIITTVADDEENPTGVPTGDVVEWNIINLNHLQDDYPVATKIVPDLPQDFIKIFEQIIDGGGFYNEDKFSGVKNPFTPVMNILKETKEKTGDVSASMTAKIHRLLEEHNIRIFVASSED